MRIYPSIHRELEDLLCQKSLPGLSLEPLLSRKLINFFLTCFAPYRNVRPSTWQRYLGVASYHKGRCLYKLCDVVCLFSSEVKAWFDGRVS